MAVVTSHAHKTIGSTFTNRPERVKLTYDFSEDAGSKDNTVKLATIASNLIILSSTVHVETACTSGGSATVAIGAATADADGIIAATAVATLVANYTKQTATGQGLYVGKDDAIAVTIATADLTAGKIHVYLEYISI